jgi:hypothetical protein
MPKLVNTKIMKTQLMLMSYSTMYVRKLLYTTCQWCPTKSYDKNMC